VILSFFSILCAERTEGISDHCRLSLCEGAGKGNADNVYVLALRQVFLFCRLLVWSGSESQ
jgi:hypothetical protein